jgi:hypothetical protein
VVQLLLADDLNSGKLNVALAGETHYELPDNEERAAWAKSGIDVHYEGDSLPLNDGSSKKVTPDPVKLRLAFGYTRLNEYVSPYLEASYKPGKSADVAGAKDAGWVLGYLLPVLIGDLGRRPDSQAKEVDPLIEVLKELRAILRGGKLTAVVGDELARRVLASKVRRDLDLVGDFVKHLHDESAFSAVEFKSSSLMVARSQQMLKRVNDEAGSLDNTIYKVGNNHVLDMQRERWAPNPKVSVLERTDYLKEYRAQVSRGAPVVPSVPVPKSGGVPVSVPVQSPVKPPVASAPKRKKPKEAKPKVVVKSAAELQVEQIKGILDQAPQKVREAQGFQDLEGAVGNYKVRVDAAEDIISRVRQIIKERNDRWALTKFLVRSKETQDLYDNISRIIG